MRFICQPSSENKKWKKQPQVLVRPRLELPVCLGSKFWVPELECLIGPVWV